MKMKSGLFKEKFLAEIVTVDRPVPGPDDVLIKTVRSSICGSDVNGVGVAADKEFGHETAGYIVEAGKNVVDFKEGDRVWINPMETMPKYQTCKLPGFTEYILIQKPVVDKQLWFLPESISWDAASLIEPFGVGTRGKNRPNAQLGDNVVVYGAGSIGLFCISALAAQGITPVVIDIALSDYKRELLNKIGAVAAPLPEEGDRFEFLAERFGTLPQRQSGEAINVDIVVDCAGAPNIVEDFFKLSKANARLSCVGVNKNPIPIPMNRLMSSEVVLMGSSGYDNTDIREVIDNLAAGKARVEDIITHHYPLEYLSEALRMAGNKEEAIKVVIDME